LRDVLEQVQYNKENWINISLSSRRGSSCPFCPGTESRQSVFIVKHSNNIINFVTIIEQVSR